MSTAIASPGKTGDGEAPVLPAHPRRIVAAQGQHQRAAGDAEGRHAVQDRPVEAGAEGARGVAMQRIVVPREAVDQRLTRPRLERDRVVGRTIRDRLGGERLGGLRPAEPALPARERRLAHRAVRLAGGTVDNRALGDDEPALALVDHVGDLGLRLHRRLRRQRAGEPDGLFAVDDARIVDAGAGPAHPVRRHGENIGHRRHRAELGLVDELQLLLVERIVAVAEAQAVDDAVAPADVLDDLRQIDIEEHVGIEHCRRVRSSGGRIVLIEGLASACRRAPLAGDDRVRQGLARTHRSALRHMKNPAAGAGSGGFSL